MERSPWEVPSDPQIQQHGSRFGNTWAYGSIVQQGNFITINTPAAGRPDYRGHFSHSLLAPVQTFVPRDLLRDQVRVRLCDGATRNTTSTLAVWGLGGAGKTQLVLDYVQKYRETYKSIFWFQAGQKDSLDRDFVSLYLTLFDFHSVAGQEAPSAESAAAGVKSWFVRQPGPWLLVFDGADTIDDERAQDYINIKHYIPDVPHLHVIITTRSGVAKGMTQLGGVQVGDMEENQAVELFYRCSDVQRGQQSREEVTKIVQELGYLALAVTLAGAYVGATRELQTDIKAYLPEYRQRRRKLLEQRPQSLIHQYSESVLTTWETSYQAIERGDCPEAVLVMTLISFMSSDDVFTQLFSSLAEDTPELDRYKIRDCFRILERYSLVQWKDDQRSFSMHKLVHAWGYDRLDEGEQRAFGTKALALVSSAIAACSNRPQDKLRLVPHVMANFDALVQSGTGSDSSEEVTIDELERTGMFLDSLGRFGEERKIQEFVMTVRRRILGEEHPNTLSAMSNLASTLGDQGHLEEAAQMKSEVLQRRQRILGEEHPDTITTMNNLAITLGDQGQLEEAAQMKREVLQKRRQILGEEHPDTLSAMNNLAATLGDQGQLSEAAQMKREVLEKMRRILGAEHPSTLAAINNLANTLRGQGQLSEAAQMKREVLEKRRRILGAEHPSTLAAINNLANTLRDQGQFEEAAQIQREVLEKRRRILGEEHPDTLGVMNNLANTLRGQG